jgi:hypothetical protein
MNQRRAEPMVPGSRMAASRRDRLMRLGPWPALAMTMLCLVSPALGQAPSGALVGTPNLTPEAHAGASVAPQSREFGVEDVSILNIGPCALQLRSTSFIARLTAPV